MPPVSENCTKHCITSLALEYCVRPRKLLTTPAAAAPAAAAAAAAAASWSLYNTLKLESTCRNARKHELRETRRPEALPNNELYNPGPRFQRTAQMKISEIKSNKRGAQPLYHHCPLSDLMSPSFPVLRLPHSTTSLDTLGLQAGMLRLSRVTGHRRLAEGVHWHGRKDGTAFASSARIGLIEVNGSN